MDPLDDDSLPRGIALAWGVAANPQRGPKRELNIELIVDAAIQIADEQGLSAVSMSSVATALGFTTMSLYRYVTAKDDLILLMQEVGMGAPPLSIAEASDWRDGLLRWYRAVLDVFAAHPWILDVPIVGAPNTPNNLSWLEIGLEVLKDTPLDQRSRVAAMLLLSGQSRWEAQIARNYMREGEVAAATAALATLMTPEQFPYLYPAIVAGAFDADADNPFEFGVSRVLDGIAKNITDISSGRSAPPQPPDPDRTFARDEHVKKARERVKDAEGKLRDARQKEREAIAKARERAAKLQ
jgi:AcrR family transcriptional regulator